MDIMDTQQENTLEKSLRLAADEPAHRPEFFTTLLNSSVYVLGATGTYFLKQTTPFYERKSAGWLRSLFGFGKA